MRLHPSPDSEMGREEGFLSLTSFVSFRGRRELGREVVLAHIT